MKTVIFLGPTMSVADARAIIDDALYLPPACQTDLLNAAVNLKPDVIALIDGVFLRTNSVWHKEILHAMELGIRVYGASSMGALRAAETAPFGMIGVGEVFELYRSGELLDDDEVALAHGPEEFGYTKLSEPMVNLRATFSAAHAQRVIDERELTAVMAAAKGLHFAERAFPVIFERVLEGGVSRTAIERLSHFVKTSYVDMKRQDAVRLLELLRDLPATSEQAAPAVTAVRTAGFETMYNCDRSVRVGDVEVRQTDIAKHVAVQAGDYNLVHFNAMNRIMAVALAKLLHLEPSAEEIAAESARLRLRCGVVDDVAFESWLADNHLPPDDFRALMRETALCRRLHRWFSYARWTQRSTRLLLDQLKWENRYAEWAKRAAAEERVLAAAGNPHLSADVFACKATSLLEEHQEWSDIVVDTDIETWADDAGFHGKTDLKLELLRARCARNALLHILGECARDDEDDAAAAVVDAADAASPPADAGQANELSAQPCSRS